MSACFPPKGMKVPEQSHGLDHQAVRALELITVQKAHAIKHPVLKIQHLIKHIAGMVGLQMALARLKALGIGAKVQVSRIPAGISGVSIVHFSRAWAFSWYSGSVGAW